MDKNIFYTFYYYFLLSRAMRTPKDEFSFSFYKIQTHSVRSGMNYFKVQARLFINFNSNIVESRHTHTRLYDHLVITTIFSRFKRRNQAYFNFYFFRKSPVNATTSFSRL